MDVDLIAAINDWRGILALIVAAYTLPKANLAQVKAVHIRLPFPLRGIRAITLFPLVLYEQMTDEDYDCIRAHELVHVAQARSMGPALFYGVYVYHLLRGLRGRAHPLEVPGYEAQDACYATRFADSKPVMLAAE